jgi:molecular chaperone HtpG
MTTAKPSTSGQMTINLPGVIKTLGESLYSDPSVSIRELIQNANDTCVVRQADDPSAPHGEIHIRVDSWRGTLVVEDNGAGMTEEEVKEFLTVIGSSKTEQVRARLEQMGESSLAERLIGRFGLGLLSAFIIGDRIEFVTLSYKEGSQPIWWECDGGQEYKMGPAEGRTTVGTIVTVYVNPKHVGMLKEDKLTELIHLYAELLEVPIYLYPIPRPINAMSAPWHRQASEAEYRQFVADRYPGDAILDIIPIELSEDDGKFKVGGVLFVPKQPLFIVREHGDAIVYVRRMFVCKDERTLLPDWAKFVKGVVESPNLRETTSREAILHDENLERVQRALGRVILDYLTRVSNENPRLFKEIVTNHNLVIKAWAIASDELFDRIKDIVLFTTDAGTINLPRYFEMSRYSKGVAAGDSARRYIFYFTTPGGAGQHTMLFAAKGLRVIDAQHFPDEGFLQKYANKHEDVILKRLDVGGEFIFEELERRERKWVELEEEYSHQRIDAKVVRFVPEDLPAVLIFPETEPVTDQVEGLLADPNLSAPLKNLVKQMWEDREKQRRGRISSGGILYVNANNPVVQKLVDLDLLDLEIQEVMIVIYNNALMLSTQGARMYLAPESAKKVFESNNRAIAALMSKIYEIRDLKAHQLAEMGERVTAQLTATERSTQPAVQTTRLETPAAEPNRHIVCLLAVPFEKDYDVLLEALRDVLEVAPYFWQVARADKRFFANDVPNNMAYWIARAQCFAADISEMNENVMMEVGLMYWGYPSKPLLLLQRDTVQSRIVDLGGRLRVKYPWGDLPDQSRMAMALHQEIKKFEELKNLNAQAHYLSVRLMRADFIPPILATALADRYETVEDLIQTDAAAISHDLGIRFAPTGVVQEVQSYLHDVCGIK